MLSSIKCVLVGDSAVGKTSLLVRFTCGNFPWGYKPTVWKYRCRTSSWMGSKSAWASGTRPAMMPSRSIRPPVLPAGGRGADVLFRGQPQLLPEPEEQVDRWSQEQPALHPVLVVATQTDQRESGAPSGLLRQCQPKERDWPRMWEPKATWSARPSATGRPAGIWMCRPNCCQPSQESAEGGSSLSTSARSSKPQRLHPYSTKDQLEQREQASQQRTDALSWHGLTGFYYRVQLLMGLGHWIFL